MTGILVAPNAFKGSLTALEAAAAMSAAVSIVLPDADIVARPIADGGDGSVEALIAAGFERVTVPITLPDGSAGTASIAMRENLAVVELANTCGLLLTPATRRDPLGSSTVGLGEAVLGALDLEPAEIVLAVGGSASTDGGVGLLVALGARVLDQRSRPVQPGGQWLADIVYIDLATIDPRLRGVRLTVATDVSSPLYGPLGAAVVFAPQKGATPAQVAHLDDGLRSWAEVVRNATHRDVSTEQGGGAAGGTAFAAVALLGAELVPGADAIARMTGLDEALGACDLVITGEGSLDGQSLLGKGAVHIAREAQQRRVPSLMVCGHIDLVPDVLCRLGVQAWGSIDEIADTPEDAMTRAAELLTRRTIEVLALVEPPL